MAEPSNAPGPAAPLPPAPSTVPSTPRRPGFSGAPVGWVIAGMLVFWPTGIPALLASHRAASAFGAGDDETAQRESSDARRWGITSVIVGVCLFALVVLVWIASIAFFVLVAHEIDDGPWQDGPTWSEQQPFGGDQGEDPLPFPRPSFQDG